MEALLHVFYRYDITSLVIVVSIVFRYMLLVRQQGKELGWSEQRDLNILGPGRQAGSC